MLDAELLQQYQSAINELYRLAGNAMLTEYDDAILADYRKHAGEYYAYVKGLNRDMGLIDLYQCLVKDIKEAKASCSKWAELIEAIKESEEDPFAQ